MITLLRINANNIIRNAITHPISTTVRYKTFYKTGAIRPMPKVLPFGFLGLIGSVVPGKKLRLDEGGLKFFVIV